MARVRSRDTAPELQLRKELSRRGVRYRLHSATLPGKPDIYIGRLKLALFVNGCFWHGHDCARGRRPSTNVAFWNAKIENNQIRDAKVARELAERGIASLAIWSCGTRKYSDVATRIAALYKRPA